ncbi:MAG: 4Fe-4S dicluster domain-containing protein [Dehalococcoidia bacterium]|nr:4Fe-4S dicluster domain-containing protein [Dehalococcoidia bacterium]
MLEPAHREIFFNIQFGWLIYILAPLATLLLIFAVFQRFRLWRIGQKDDTFSNLNQKIKAFVRTATVDGIFHKKILSDPYPGIMHALIFWGALLLLLGTAMDVISHYIYEFLHGNTYLAISFLADLGGVMILVGLIMAVYRRYFQKPERLDNIPADSVGLGLVFIVVLTGFILEGMRMVAASAPDEWAQWSFLGYGFSKAFTGTGAIIGWYQGLWWFHSVLVVGVIGYMAFSLPKLAHMFISPFNAFLTSTAPKGALRTIAIEEAETFGANRIQDFPVKDLMDLDSCTRCGRCQDQCPAHLTDKPLSPKKLVQDLKPLLVENTGFFGLKVKKPGDDAKTIIGDAITEDQIWSCTTCRACVEQCPAFVAPMNKIIEMRRNLVLEQTRFPETAMGALRSMEQRGHPWRGTMATRTDWADGLNVTEVSGPGQIDVLYWVGCTAALEERNIKVATAVGKLLKAAGVNFGIMGTSEMCCGEPARRIGNEYLFQTLAQQNVESLKALGVKKIVTACPHCFNTIKNEYPQFGGDFEVVHHTEFIAGLLREGKLRVGRVLDKKATYHDSCYLGRYNGVYDAPREILGQVTGSPPVEMEHRMAKSFCCGAGGGRMWMEEQIGKRINHVRTQEAVKVNAEILASACPYCLQMFEDAIKTLEVEGSLKAMDLAEILAGVIEESPTAGPKSPVAGATT